MDYAGRLQRLQDQLPAHGLDALLVTHLPNIRYLSGYAGGEAMLLVHRAGAVMLVHGRNPIPPEDEGNARIVMQTIPFPLMYQLTAWLEMNQREIAGRDDFDTLEVGIEADNLTVEVHQELMAGLEKNFRLKEAPQLIERLRMIKDADEIRLMRAAAELGASLFSAALSRLRPGVTENSVAAAMEYEARMKGAEGMAFPTIVASGKRSAIEHGHASQQVIPPLGFVVCDFGVILAGYCSDRTRTVYVGSASQEAQDFYAAVLEAQLAGIAAVRPGARPADVDAAARDALSRSKLAEYFTHSTGHGIGLEIHEAPRVARGEKTWQLEPGMVITIEPGAYVPGKWGVRIEDTVLVTEDGCEVLSPSDKQLIVLD